MDTIHIDGSHGEGGGQVLRTSLSLAMLLGRELTIDRIRAGRPKPGLAAQHVTSVLAAARVCGARVEGADIGSQSLRFTPGRPAADRYCFDVADVRPSAGSTGLVFQTVLPALLFSGGASQLTIRGGTNVPWSPCYEYLREVFLPTIARAGVDCSLRRTRGGWYPSGGGQIVSRIQPLDGSLRPLNLPAPGALSRLLVTSVVSSTLPDPIAHRQAGAALKLLPHEVSRVARRVVERPEGGPGTCLAIAASFRTGNAGATALGERGKPAEKVGAEAADRFIGFLSTKAAVDLHLADQILLYAALAAGKSVILAEATTEHLRTNIWVIRQFLDVEMTVEGDGPVLIRVQGVGFAPEY